MESTGPSEITARLRLLSEALHGGSTLDEMALGVSAAMRDDFDLIGALAALDELAGDCPTPTRDGVMLFLFESGMFQPDRSDYHSWRNSCLDEVLARRIGMPITLSILAIEVARRVGVRLVGVGLPGHFIVGDPSDPEWFADPFHARSGLGPDDCRDLVVRMGLTRWSTQFLDPVPDRLVIARILNNLKSVSAGRNDAVRYAIVMQARQLFPEFASEREDAHRSLAALN